MEAFRESFLILFSTPVYALLIGLEMLMSYIHHRHYYTARGTLMNIYLSALNMGLDILLRGVCLLVIGYFFPYHLFEIKNPFWYWFVLVIAEDFMFYWLHRIDHYCRFFWAVHVTHHSSEEFNLTVGFRSSVFQPLYRFVWFIPLSLLGFKGIDIMFVYSATQIYGILIHTRFVGKLGPLEWILSTPSHHRVHHGSNVAYLDRNMGMVLIIWDRLFGTFTEEKEEVKFGLTKNLEQPYHPIKTVFHEWANILKDLKKKTSFKNKLLYVFGPPGWSHDGSTKTSNQLRAEQQKR